MLLVFCSKGKKKDLVISKQFLRFATSDLVCQTIAILCPTLGLSNYKHACSWFGGEWRVFY